MNMFAPTYLCRVSSSLLLSFGAVAGLLAVSPAHADSPTGKYYCIDGTYPSSWGIGVYSAPQPGKQCYDTLDAADAATNQPPVEFWQGLPTDVNTNVPPPGSFDPEECGMTLPQAMEPGEVYWGRCNNGLMVAMMKPPAPGGAWWAPPPPQAATAARERLQNLLQTLSQARPQRLRGHVRSCLLRHAKSLPPHRAVHC